MENLFNRDYIDDIKDMALFRNIDYLDMPHMLGCLNGYTKNYSKGEYIYVTDEPMPAIGVVLSGTVQMVKEDIWGHKTILAISERGDLFGESFVCAGVPVAGAAFVTSAPTRVLFLPFQRVMHSCSRACVFHHQLVENMMIMVAKKNMRLMDKLEVTSKKTLRDKILSYLSIQAQRTGTTKYIEVPMGRVQLAEYLCADRSALTRELSNMKKEGILDYDRNTFVLLR